MSCHYLVVMLVDIAVGLVSFTATLVADASAADLTIFVRGSQADVHVSSFIDPLGRGTDSTLTIIPACEIWEAVIDADIDEPEASRPVVMVHVGDPIPGDYRFSVTAEDSTIVSISASVHRGDWGFCTYHDTLFPSERQTFQGIVRYAEATGDSCDIEILMEQEK